MSDEADSPLLGSRCTCTHRYPHHHGNGSCLRCDCPGFTFTTELVVRVRRGPPCPSCGAELFITPPGEPCGRCRRGVSP